jgi:hypothetical protein
MMDKDKLTENLFNVSRKIQLIYYQLYELDKKGLKDSEEYRKLIHSLVYCKEMENEFYLGVKKINDYGVLWANLSKTDSHNQQKLETFFHVSSLIPRDRIKNRMYHLANLKSTSNNVLECLDYDIFKQLLDYFDNEIKGTDNQDDKNLMLFFKYKVAYLNEMVEMELICNSFEPNEMIGNKTKNDVVIASMKKSDVSKIKNDYLINIFVKQYLWFLDKNFTKNEDTDFMELLLRYSYLKSIISMLDSNLKGKCLEYMQSINQKKAKKGKKKVYALIKNVMEEKKA